MSSRKGQVDPVRGEVWLVDLDPAVGHEQAGRRPTMIISDDTFNRSPAEMVIVTPITSTMRGVRSHVPVHPPEGGLTRPSVILSEQIRTVSKRRLVRRLGVVSASTLHHVEKNMRFILGL